MNSNETRGHRSGRGGRRPSPRNDQRRQNARPARPNDKPKAEKKLSLWCRIVAFFTGGGKKQTSPARPPQAQRGTSQESSRGPRENREPRESRENRRATPPERVEVTSAKIYVGNLSYEATESDLFDLFNGVGKVQVAEVVTQKGTYRSKGFAFVTMTSVEEARRAVVELHDKPFMGRKLVVSGSKSEGARE